MDLDKELSIFKAGKPNDVYAKYFKGHSYLNVLNTEGLKITNVTFEPRCRNNWHIHYAKSGGGQILVCVYGRGWVQFEGYPAIQLNPGDTFFIPTGIKHWHGATKDTWFQHLVIDVPGECMTTEWGEAVSDEEYDALHGKTLIVFYSLTSGNTRRIAGLIEEKKHYDVVELKPYDDYSHNFSVSMVQRVKTEVSDKYQPELYDLGVDLDKYDKIILGTPTWWYTMASPVLSFLHNPKLRNKTIIPFQTNGGYPGHVEDDINRELRNSGCVVENFLRIDFDSDDAKKQITPQSEIDKWIESL